MLTVLFDTESPAEGVGRNAQEKTSAAALAAVPPAGRHCTWPQQESQRAAGQGEARVRCKPEVLQVGVHSLLLQLQAKAAQRNIYKEVADRAAGLTPDSSKMKATNCRADDDNCYDHTNNTGIGPIKVLHEFPPKEKAPYDYAEVLHKSFIFYYLQRSGELPQQVWSPFLGTKFPITVLLHLIHD